MSDQMTRTMLLIAGASIAMIVTAAPALCQDDATVVTRPAYSFLRYREDWSSLANQSAEEESHFWDAIKYVPLTDDGNVWASFGGHARLRLESWSNFGFGAAADASDTFALWRLALHADVHIGDQLRFFVEGKSALATDRSLPGGRRTLDVDTLALEQAFADLTLPLGSDDSVTLRAGRQQFLFGKQRLVSPLPWANTLRRWDGLSAIFDVGDWSVHSFWSQFAPVQKYEFNDADSQTQFFGAYATGRLNDLNIGIDLYALGLDRDDAVTFNGTTGSETRFTLGGRLFGNIGSSPLDYDFEGAYQFGEVGAGDVDAFMIGSQLGFRPEGMGWNPRFFVGFDYASGDKTAGGDVQTFNQLFPLAHAYYGYIDAIGRQNAVDFSGGATFQPMDKLTIGLTGHALYRADTADALYNAGGAVSRPGAAGTSRELGYEFDLTARYKFDTHLSGLLGYSHFFAGDFIEQSGASDDIDFLYLQLQYTF